MPKEASLLSQQPVNPDQLSFPKHVLEGYPISDGPRIDCLAFWTEIFFDTRVLRSDVRRNNGLSVIDVEFPDNAALRFIAFQKANTDYNGFSVVDLTSKEWLGLWIGKDRKYGFIGFGPREEIDTRLVNDEDCEKYESLIERSILAKNAKVVDNPTYTDIAWPFDDSGIVLAAIFR